MRARDLLVPSMAKILTVMIFINDTLRQIKKRDRETDTRRRGRGRVTGKTGERRGEERGEQQGAENEMGREGDVISASLGIEILFSRRCVSSA